MVVPGVGDLAVYPECQWTACMYLLEFNVVIQSWVILYSNRASFLCSISSVHSSLLSCYHQQYVVLFRIQCPLVSMCCVYCWWGPKLNHVLAAQRGGQDEMLMITATLLLQAANGTDMQDHAAISVFWITARITASFHAGRSACHLWYSNITYTMLCCWAHCMCFARFHLAARLSPCISCLCNYVYT